MTVTDIKDITSFKWATVTAVNPLAIKLDGDSSALALIPDSLIDPLSLGVNDRVRVELSLRKCVIHGAANGGDGFGAGDVIATARTTARTGWMLCQGQSLLRSAFPRLFAAIGTTYGAADSTHFNVPNYKGRTLVGLDSAQTEFYLLGEVGGAKTVTIGVTNLPTNVTIEGGVAGGNLGSAGSYNTVGRNGAFGQAMTNLPPYAVANYMIKL